MEASNYNLRILFLFLSVMQLHAQNNDYKQDSLRVEELTNGLETYYENSDLYKKNFPLALDIIEKKILNKNQSHYFQVRKAAIKDRQSVFLKTEERYDEALVMLLENVSYKERIKDFKTLAYSYRLIASIFVWQGNYVKAKQYYNTALKLARKYRNKKEEIESLLSLSRLFVITNDILDAQQKLDTALLKLNNYHYPYGLSRAYASYSILMRQQKQYEKAIGYSRRQLQSLEENKDTLSLGFAYFNLGVTYQEYQKYGFAIKSIKKSIDIEGDSVSPGRIKSRFLMLSQCYEAIEDYKNGYLYATKYIEANENEKKIKSYKSTVELEAKFKYKRQQVLDSLELVQKRRELEFSIKKKANNRFWLVVGVLVLLLIFLGFLFYNRKQKTIKTELKNKLLKAEIESKKRDLSEFALSLNHDKEWTKKLFKQFEKFKHSKEEEKNNEIEVLEKEILQKLNYDDINKEFNRRLDSLSNTFYDNLKNRYPNLTKNEIRLCTLIKLKIDSPEIANLQNISIASVNTSRYRLRKKLNLSSSSQSLNDFIDKFV